MKLNNFKSHERHHHRKMCARQNDLNTAKKTNKLIIERAKATEEKKSFYKLFAVDADEKRTQTSWKISNINNKMSYINLS